VPQGKGRVVSVADDKLNATAGRVTGGGLGLLTGLRAQHPRAAALVIRGAEVAAWVAFYFAVRALTG
jgi:hypothetical protein